MSIAAKCECGFSVSGICLDRIPQCTKIIRTFDSFCIENQVTGDESRKLKAFLFALRHSDVDTIMLEGIIKKYSHLL